MRLAELAPEIEAVADLLIVNKFGEHEVGGRGYRGLIVRALELNIPVVVGTNAMNEEAFLEFPVGYTTGVGHPLGPLPPLTAADPGSR